MINNPFPKNSARSIIWDNLNLYKQCYNPFFSMFHVHLSVFWFDNLSGFNVGKFNDEFLHVSKH